jgi:hypothetical protein
MPAFPERTLVPEAKEEIALAVRTVRQGEGEETNVEADDIEENRRLLRLSPVICKPLANASVDL